MFCNYRAVTASILLTLILPFSLAANQWVKVAKDPENGWRMLVDGEAMAIHGVVWSFTPIGENYSYVLWDQPEEIIQEMIDRDAALMQEMGVNAIRVFADIPPKWVSYLYQRYGIFTIINDLFGRYGLTVDGRWHARTNYADLRTREIILESMRKNISQYVNVPGVLFYMLGNENNYGLEWDSNTIENLPVGQRLEVRAGYLYSLFEEGIEIVKEIDPTKPVGIVNGDIQYLNIINELVPSLDILGVNTYRGDGAYDLFYESVAETLDVPIVYTEFGADAFNVIEEREDQLNQAIFIKKQWEEIYRQSYGKGRNQNILGGFVFSWMDEWWKAGDDLDELDVHNDYAGWSNGAYSSDAAYGKNNMNEEWWGIVAQSPVKTNGVHERVPRAAYYVLKDLWKLDQINSTDEEISQHFDFDILPYVNRAQIAAIRQQDEEAKKVRFRGEVEFAAVGNFDDVDIKGGGLDKISSSFGEWAYLGVDLEPFEKVDAGLTLRVQGHVPETTFELEEYSRYEPLAVQESAFVKTGQDNETHSSIPPVEIYDAYLNLETKFADVDLYYHNGHSDWALEGDFFHLLPESFDYIGMDINKSKAPFGLEISGNEFLDGLKIYGGPEIYWGADPQVMAKYFREGETLSWSLMYTEPISQADPKEDKPLPGGRRASAWLGLNFFPWITVDIGTLFSGSNYLGDSYTHVGKNPDGSFSSSTNSINALDTLSGKIELTSEILLYTKFFARYIYAGRVAASKPYSTRDGSQINDVGTGNRHEFFGGVRFQYGGIGIMPQFLARLPISYPQKQGTGIARSGLYDPVAVWKNREAYQAEIVLTFDPRGDTYFFDWNNADRENAKFAGYLSFLYSFYEGPTDSAYYKNEFGDWAGFAEGLPAVSGLWSVKSRILWNAASKLRFVFGFNGGYGQSWGQDTRLVNYWGLDAKMRLGAFVISSSVDINAWGHADWMRQLNITFPLQWTLDLSYGFDIPSLLNSQNRIGVRWKGRTYDQYAPDADTARGEKWNMEILGYLSFTW